MDNAQSEKRKERIPCAILSDNFKFLDFNLKEGNFFLSQTSNCDHQVKGKNDTKSKKRNYFFV